MDCELKELIERHSRAIVVGRVAATRGRGFGDALVYWRGDYHPVPHASAESAVNQWEPTLQSRNMGCG